MEKSEDMRKKAIAAARGYWRARQGESKGFDRESPCVPVSGKVMDEEDVSLLVDASLDMWLTTGRFADMFESRLSSVCGIKHAMLVNSGSSANLLAISALTSRFLGGRKIKKGAEVITTATSFPTTVNPIFQNGLVPVFLDIELGSCNMDISLVEAAITEKTRAVIAAHTLGNPFDSAKLSEICKKHNLFLIEDCCDALGAKVAGKPVGAYGDFATLSFYPAHHITMGEGGAVLTGSDILRRSAESFRDWGRDCWCKPGCDNTCGKRFGWKLGGLPFGYDHKYIYSNIGYNLKATDMQAAVGLSQLKKLPGFIKARQDNFNFLLKFFSKYGQHFLLPQVLPGAEASPFGYLVNIRHDAPFKRAELVSHLESRGIATRMLFGGNLTCQPAYLGEDYRVDGKLENANHVMNNAFWIGTYPGITREMRGYTAETLDAFLKKF